MSTTSTHFTALSVFGIDGCIPRMDVDTDDIGDYTTMTLEEALKIYWLAESVSISGSYSFSSSASGNGNYKKYILVYDPATGQTNPQLDQEWSENISVTSINETGNFAVFGNEPEPTEPYERVCGNENYFYVEKLDSNNKGNNVTAPLRKIRHISCNNSGGVNLTNYDSYTDYYNEGDKPIIRVTLPSPQLRRFYDDDEFVGYGFAGDLVTADCRVDAGASYSAPLLISAGGMQGEYLNVNVGGKVNLSNISYISNDMYDMFFGTEELFYVKFMGVDMIATTTGFNAREDCLVEQDGEGIKISGSDSDSASPSFPQDTRGSSGAGETFSGSGNISASASFQINIGDPVFWEY